MIRYPESAFKNLNLRNNITIKQSQRGGIMDALFGPKPAPAPQPPKPGDANPQNLQTQQTQQTDVNGVIPNPANPSQKTEEQKQEDVSPLDKHKDVWNAPLPQAEKPIFEGLDPTKLQEALSKANVVGNIMTPELSAKIAAGGEGAVQALTQALNQVGQTVLANNATATAKMIDAALEKQQQRFQAQLPSLVKSLAARDGLVTQNPVLNHPVAKPIAEALQDSFLRKNPNATAGEIQQQVMDVFASLGEAFAAKPTTSTSAKKGADDVDWGIFLEGPAN